MSKHTPGPWGIERTDDTNWIGFMRPHDPKKVELIVCTTSRELLTDEALARNDANARLIAAAPDLLAALQVAELALRERGLRACGEYKQIEAAIAKATGEA
ncbi:hypothetical protein B9Y74_05540 [Stenotrophomonas maltophilia]|uniref:hypothetical protein n=1 Tax=Stenotrophomonas maltophilia TaxID=40324 RepID=UPI000C25F7D8|nr:hypothetical protein [Stenotrophomonas maltophilia]PJL51459.1 hypothetical protein B9Y74_05540 [Stenotrophomonas maltophilia]